MNIGSVDGTMKLFQLSGKRLLQTFVHCVPQANAGAMQTIREGEDDMDAETTDGQTETFSVECVGFATHGARWVASGGMDSTLKVWDLDFGTCRCTCLHTSTVTHLQWHASSPMITTSTVSGNICIWDARAGLQLAELTGHRGQVTYFASRSVQLPSGGNREVIATASDDKSCRVFLVDAKGLL
jgi:WD40 repeat protein